MQLIGRGNLENKFFFLRWNMLPIRSALMIYNVASTEYRLYVDREGNVQIRISREHMYLSQIITWNDLACKESKNL